jgi:anti-sigma-K factor RskA
MSHDVMETHAAAYALGALDGDDLDAFERHLASGCAACETYVREASEALAKLSDHPSELSPPPRVKEALMRRAAVEGHRMRGARRWPRVRLTWAAATAAAMVIAGLGSWYYAAARYEARLGRLAHDAAIAELLRQPGARVVDLRPTGPAPGAHGRVVWHDTSGGRLIVSNLPAAGAGKAYELWTIRSGTPQAAGTFGVDDTGAAVVGVAPTGGAVDVFAITLEPAGGVPAPTGPIVLASGR